MWTLLNVYERKQALDKDTADDDGRMPIPEVVWKAPVWIVVSLLAAGGAGLSLL